MATSNANIQTTMHILEPMSSHKYNPNSSHKVFVGLWFDFFIIIISVLPSLKIDVYVMLRARGLPAYSHLNQTVKKKDMGSS